MARKRIRPNQTAQAEPLTSRVINYFKANPNEVLDRKDVAGKFSVSTSSVDTLLASAVSSGLIERQVSDELGVIYRQPIKRGAFPTAKTPALRAAGKQARRAKRPDFKVDFASIKIDKGVPLPETQKRQPPWDLLFARMDVGDSFELPIQARSAASQARRTYQQRVDGKQVFAIRTISETTCRVWRLV